MVRLLSWTGRMEAERTRWWTENPLGLGEPFFEYCRQIGYLLLEQPRGLRSESQKLRVE
jgi:hypothetical protein